MSRSRLVGAVTFLLGLAWAGARSPGAQEVLDLSYRFILKGDEARPVSGTVWLYHYSWYGLDRFKLAPIEEGRARLRLSEVRLRSEVRPHLNTETFVVVLELPGRPAMRTADLDPSALLRDLPAHLNGLGQARAGPAGETMLVLPPPGRRRITLRHEDGRAAAHLEVPVAIYLYDRNHCGHHEGLDLGTYRTDATGTIQVEAAAVPLYLSLAFYEPRGQGPAGPAYWAKLGVKTGAEPSLVLRRAWELPQRDFELRARGPGGAPLAGASVIQHIRTRECGVSWGQVAVTDATGVARLRIAAAATEGLRLEQDGRRRELTEGELRRLFTQGRITLGW